MTRKRTRKTRARGGGGPRLAVVLGGCALALGIGGCGGGGRDAPPERDGGQAAGDLSGRIVSDGSSTVAPLTTLASERFSEEQPGVQVTVGVSGTGGGFERFCAGETDIANASRPIKDEEKARCRRNGVEYAEVHVANDALTVVVNPENDWAECLTVEQVRAIWRPGSKIRDWSDVPNADFPDTEMTLYGPGTDSGTFDYFTDEIVGEEGASRSDYSASEDDNVIVQGVSGDRGALGYFGFSYYDQNRDKLKAVAIDGGEGCVQPSAETTQSGDYRPLARPLYAYVRREALRRPEVERFVAYVLANQREIAKDALFVPMTEAQVAEARRRVRESAGR